MRIACFLLLLTACPAIVRACGCDTLSFNDALRASEIFIGELYKVETFTYNHSSPYTEPYGYDRVNTGWRHYFKVKKKWKGGKSDVVTIDNYNTSCDFSFSLTTNEYLIYTYQDAEEKTLYSGIKEAFSIPLTGTYMCARNINILGHYDMNWFHKDTALLNQKFPHPIKLASYQNRQITCSTGLVLLIAVGFWWIRRRRKNKSIQSPLSPPPAH